MGGGGRPPPPPPLFRRACSVFDQAIYAKAVEVIWKHSEAFKSIVPRLGAFHTIKVLLAIIGQRFGDAGLRDIIIESSVIEEGSVKKVLDGTHYNRAVRFHKRMYESCMRILWSGLQEWFKSENTEHGPVVQNLPDQISEMVDGDLEPEVFRTHLEHPSTDFIFKNFKKYLDIMRNANGTMSAFWMTYVDLTGLLLNFIRASREGDWDLHLSSISKLIPWCFAYNHSNYARYLPWYLLQMLNIPKTNPELYEYLINGGCSTQIGENNTYGCIPMDQAIEETINKDTQTAGGTKGFITKKV